MIELLGPALLLEGNVLHGDTAGAHVGVRMGSLSTEVEIDAPSITADGLWGALSIGVTGGVPRKLWRWRRRRRLGAAF